MSLFLAQGLCRLKKRVLLFDADLGLANIHILSGICPRYNLAHAVRQECKLEDIFCEGPGGITVVPGASGLEAMANLDSSTLDVLVSRLVRIENQYDFMIVDTGAGIGQAAMRMATGADTALLVLTPEPTSLADAYATAKILFKRGVERITVLVNMARSEREGKEIFEKLKALIKKFLNRDITLAAVIPHDRDVGRFVRNQRTILDEKPKSAVSLRIGAYARVLCGLSPLKEGNFFSRLFSLQEGVR
jgi:flagellar biosynthesis protein FlhG